MVEPFDEVAERAKIDSRPGFGCDADPGQVAESFAACSIRSSTAPRSGAASVAAQNLVVVWATTAGGVYSARHLQAVPPPLRAYPGRAVSGVAA